MSSHDIGGAITANFGNSALTGLTGAAVTYSTSATVVAIRGRTVSASARSGASFAGVTDAATGRPITLTTSQARVIVLCVDTTDTIRVFAGETVPLDSAGNYLDWPQFPDLPNNVCPLAYFIVRCGSTFSGTFTLGTTVWNTTGVSITTINVSQLPDRPLV